MGEKGNNMIKKYEIRPYGGRLDCEDDEYLYSNLVLPKSKKMNEVVIGSSVIYPYAFCFLNATRSDDTFVYHALIKFDNMDNEICMNRNEIDAMDKLAVNINTMKGKAVLVTALKNLLTAKKNYNKPKFTLEDQKCLEHCEEWLNWYKDADFDCALLRIVPLHLNVRSDEYGPFRTFMPMDCTKGYYKDEEREILIYDTPHEWNVRTKPGTEVELDGFVTMTVDMFPGLTPTEYAKQVKSVKEIITDKNIKTYDLYTFVATEYDYESGINDHAVYNIFWDGDVPEYDDTVENIDKMIIKSELGYQEFVKFMERNKFMPNRLMQVLRDNQNTHRWEITGVYKVYITEVITIDYRLVNEAISKPGVPAPF